MFLLLDVRFILVGILTLTVTILSAEQSSSAGSSEGMSNVRASHESATSNLFSKLTMYL